MADRPLPSYDGDAPFVFVSFSHADESLVYPEIRWLQDQGFNVWYDEGISGGSRWRDAIAGHLSGCHLLLFFVTPRSVASQVCREELEFALDETRPILSVHLEPTELPDGIRMAIANRQALFREDLDPDDYGRKLLSAVATYLDQPVSDGGTAGLRRRIRRVSLRAAIAGALLVGVVSAGGAWLADALTGAGSAGERAGLGVVRFTVAIANEDVNLQDCFNPDSTRGQHPTTTLAFSNDGGMLAYAARDRSDDTRKLFLHRLDADRAVAVTETAGGYLPFFSPDDRWLYFFDGRQVRRVPVVGGAPEVIWDVLPSTACLTGSAAWLNAGTLVTNNFAGGLSLLDAAGGEPQVLVEPGPDDGYGAYMAQHGLPDGEHVLFHRYPANLDPTRAAVFVLNVTTLEQQKLLEDAMHAHYLVRSGHLVFMRRGALMAVPFDLERLRIAGDPVVVQPGVRQALGMPNTGLETGFGQVAVSAAGHLAYLPGGLFPGQEGKLVTVARDGVATPFPGLGVRLFGQIRLSPDGRHLLFAERDGQGSSLQIYDIVRGVTRRLKTGGFNSSWTAWGPDGEFVAFSSDRAEGGWGMYRMRADGSGEPEPLVQSESFVHTASWSANGDIAFLKDGDIWILPRDGDQQPLFTSPEFEGYAAFSPDASRIAYSSEGNVYVRPYPGPGSATLVADKSWSPMWSRDGSELYFFSPGEGRPDMMVVQVQDGAFSAPQRLMPWPYIIFGPLMQSDMLVDGAFLATTVEEVDETQYLTREIRVVLNFDQLIDREGRNRASR